jgi:hypothetical protein
MSRRSSGGGKREENKALSSLQLLDYSFGDLCGFVSYSRDKKSECPSHWIFCASASYRLYFDNFLFGTYARKYVSATATLQSFFREVQEELHTIHALNACCFSDHAGHNALGCDLAAG